MARQFALVEPERDSAPDPRWEVIVLKAALALLVCVESAIGTSNHPGIIQALHQVLTDIEDLLLNMEVNAAVLMRAAIRQCHVDFARSELTSPLCPQPQPPGYGKSLVEEKEWSRCWSVSGG